MLCEHYKDALIEAAAAGAALSGELRAHLAECALCRAAFDKEQSLFAAIDSGLHAGVNTEVPTSLLPRVRTQLDEAVAPRSRWVSAFVFASASAVLALTVFLMARPPHRAPEEVAKQSSIAVPTPTAPSTLTNPVRVSSEGTQIIARVNHSHASRNSTNRHSAASSNPEVLVPPDEREGLARLVDNLRQGRVLLADAKLQSGDLTIAPSEIAPIEVKALESAQRDVR